MDIRNYRRKSFEVQAVQVTPENFEDVARWTGTHVHQDWGVYDGREHILLPTAGDGRNRHMKIAVFVGDWVTLLNGQFNRASTKTFDSVFEEIKLDRFKRFEEILKLVETRDAGVPAGDIAQQILNLS